MTNETQSILDKAVKLPDAEKLALVEEILLSLSEPDSEWNRAWAKEASVRMAEYNSGKVTAIDAADVFADLDSGLK